VYVIVCVCVSVSLSVHISGLEDDMGWLRLVDSSKLQVSCPKEPSKRDDILQMRPIILRSLLIVTTPYCGHVCAYQWSGR